MKNKELIKVQTIEAQWLQRQNVLLDVLRLDEWHPVVSGNKWFKLQYYLEAAMAKGCDTIATFGGAYSNHIVATAFACKEKGLRSVGMIRGEEPLTLSHTLQQAKTYGMQLQFISREEYRNKEAIKSRHNDVYWINEGGYGSLGARGAADIFQLVDDVENYSHVVCAVGTGTTIAGLIKSMLPHQTLMGFSVLKNNSSLEDEVKHLLSEEEKQKKFVIIHDYHFGGYAKCTAALLVYMNEIWQQHHVPLDFIYTAKAFYGLQDRIVKGEAGTSGSRVLFIHTGGLQGNLSLAEGTLMYSFP